ncbi:MAG: hypothetical protein WD403_09655 [Pirellulales bacterium]
MRTLGRSLEALGLVLPPLAMIFPDQMLIMLVSAVCLFGIGRIIEGYGGKAEG